MTPGSSTSEHALTRVLGFAGLLLMAAGAALKAFNQGGDLGLVLMAYGFKLAAGSVGSYTVLRTVLKGIAATKGYQGTAEALAAVAPGPAGAAARKALPLVEEAEAEIEAAASPMGNPATRTLKSLAIFLALGLGVLAMPARAAAPTWHTGPSVSLYELRLTGQVGQLTPGLGWQGWLDFNQKFDLGVAAFGSALGLGTAHVGAAASIAPYGCYQPIGLCVGPGLDLANLQGGVSGLFQGFAWKRNFFVVVHTLPKFWELLHVQGP